jgi:hypothetical protein
MKKMYFPITVILIWVIVTLLAACHPYKRSIREEVLLKDGNSVTGRITASDSTHLTIKKPDASTAVIPWETISDVQGLRLFSPAISVNGGVFHTPYFSVFKNENYYPTSAGEALRVGFVKYGNRFRYFHLAFIPASPYNVTKTGWGFQRYFVGTYLDNWNFYAGTEFNLLHVRYNNTPQFCIEPLMGIEKKLNAHFRLNAKTGMVFCPFSKNDRPGFHLSVGLNYIPVDFQKRYRRLTQTRIL